MGVAILVVGAVVLGIILAVGGGNGDDVGAQTLSLSASDLVADACPGAGKTAAQSGEFTHYVKITFVFEGDVPNCTFADSINAATATATGASADAMVLTIIEEPIEVGARARRLHRRHARILRGRRGRATQVILVESEEDAADLASEVDAAVADGSLEAEVQDAAPNAKISVSKKEDEAIATGPLQEGDATAAPQSQSTTVRATWQGRHGESPCDLPTLTCPTCALLLYSEA